MGRVLRDQKQERMGREDRPLRHWLCRGWDRQGTPRWPRGWGPWPRAPRAQTRKPWIEYRSSPSPATEGSLSFSGSLGWSRPWTSMQSSPYVSKRIVEEKGGGQEPTSRAARQRRKRGRMAKREEGKASGLKKKPPSGFSTKPIENLRNCHIGCTFDRRVRLAHKYICAVVGRRNRLPGGSPYLAITDKVDVRW